VYSVSDSIASISCGLAVQQVVRLAVRLHLDLIFCYKIVFGIVNVSFTSFFKFSTVTSTGGHQYKLYKSHCSHSTRSRFFAERVINVWNCLPPSVDYSTLATFRRSIDGIDFTSSLKCDTD